MNDDKNANEKTTKYEILIVFACALSLNGNIQWLSLYIFFFHLSVDFIEPNDSLISWQFFFRYFIIVRSGIVVIEPAMSVINSTSSSLMLLLLYCTI